MLRSAIFFLLLTGICANSLGQWQKLFPHTYYIADVSVAEPNFVFLIPGDRRQPTVLKSSDGAKTWEELIIKDEYAQLKALHFNDSLKGYAVSMSQLYITLDGGVSWVTHDLPTDFPTPQQIIFTSELVGYIRSDDNHMIKTEDGGESWSSLDYAPIATSYVNSFSFANDKVGYVISGSELYKTSDGGAFWEVLTKAPYGARSISAVSSNVAYYSTNYDTYKTEDGGKTWTRIYWQNAELIQSRDSLNVMIFTNYGEIYRTTNGSSFSPTYASGFSFTWRDVDIAGDFGCAIGSDYAMVVTEDGGSSWKLINIQPQHGSFRDVHFTTEQEGFIIGEDRGFIRTDDNCASWYYEERDFRDDIYQMAFSDPDTGIFIVTNNFAFTTHDGGKTLFNNDWTTPIIGHLASSDYEMINSKVIYCVGEKEKVVKSIDGGKTWSAFPFEFSNRIYDIECLNEDTCHAVGSVGKVISTWDGGGNWTVHDLPTNDDLRVVRLLNSVVGFAGGAHGTLLRTGDAGKSWTVTQLPTNFNVAGLSFIDSLKGYAISGKGEVFRTEDAGKTWKLVSVDPELERNQYIHNTFMRDTSHIYALTEQQIYRWSQPPPPEVEPPVEPPDPLPEIITGLDDGSEQMPFIYPNPTTGSFYLKNAEDWWEIGIFDLLGRPCRYQRTQKDQFAINHLPPGIYLVVVSSPSESHSFRISKK